jgi:hypothetical protein
MRGLAAALRSITVAQVSHAGCGKKTWEGADGFDAAVWPLPAAFVNED